MSARSERSEPRGVRRPAVLVLEDGATFRGESFGTVGETFGEAVFATGMTGYQETLTDPSYHRQVVIQTAPQVGNTGWNAEDDESSRIWVSGYVVRDPARRPSHWRSIRSLEDELAAHEVVGICGVDTRALTRRLRERGAMRVGISSVNVDADALRERVLGQPQMAGADLVSEVTTRQPYMVSAEAERRFTVAAIDLGIKRNTPRRLAARGIATHVLPAAASIDEVVATRPDAVFLSNGPGDPAAADAQVRLTREVLRRQIPLFGICFGNQILGRALGFDTYKLKYGHRGINQPVLDCATGRVQITAHNHGFAVDVPARDRQQSAGDPPPPAEGEFGRVTVSHVCLNDDVVEGLRLVDADTGALSAFSVQYHPEAAAGPHDADCLFDQFVALMSRSRPGKQTREGARDA